MQRYNKKDVIQQNLCQTLSLCMWYKYTIYVRQYRFNVTPRNVGEGVRRRHPYFFSLKRFDYDSYFLGRYSLRNKPTRFSVVDYSQVYSHMYLVNSVLSEILILDDNNTKLTIWSDMNDEWHEESYAFMVRIGYLRDLRVPITCFRRMSMDDNKIVQMNMFLDYGTKYLDGIHSYPDVPHVDSLQDTVIAQLVMAGTPLENILSVLMQLQIPACDKWMQYIMRCIYITASLTVGKPNGAKFFIV